MYANNKRFEQLFNIRILDENQVTWLNPKPDAGVLITCLDNGLRIPLLIFNFKTELPITNLVLHINETTTDFFKSDFRISDYIDDTWNEFGESENICLKLDPRIEMRELGWKGNYFDCQYTDQGYAFEFYFTYGISDSGRSFQVSQKLSNITIIDNGNDENENDDNDDGRPICALCR